MLLPERFFVPLQRKSVHPLGLLVLALAREHPCEVADAGERGGVLLPERFLPPLQPVMEVDRIKMEWTPNPVLSR